MESIAAYQQEFATAPLVREKALRDILVPSIVIQSNDPFDVFIFMDSVIGVDLSAVTYNRNDGIEDFTFDDIATILMQRWIADRTFWPELRKAQIKACVAAFAVAQSDGSNGSRKN
ncbi:hypothetical protein CVU75_01705 [Candidatus Dependentiae bacterium HGW-Dependentiae-1]|nr:MAG: hypothetical protein CVU75_01705 [Candidatus Dependentiae bacterium HGW-Dependentiae-1]